MSTASEGLESRTYWKRCSSCKKDIEFSTVYWVCSVSTCTRKRTGMAFCSVACWEMHLPMMRHREAYAVEERSPKKDAWLREQREEQRSTSSSAAQPTASASGSSSAASVGGVRRRVPVSAPASARDDEPDRDILIVVSKLKKYIRARSGMNTSESVMSVLSDHVRAICDAAIRTAAEDGRKTVLDRDLPPVRRES
ncbi:MAG: hypothetical protein Tsb0020_43340 [Haliangiales bacterium]